MMNKYKELIKAEAIKVDVGINHAIKCPWCIERKGTEDIAAKLYIVRELGLIKYFCQSASCHVKGIIRDESSIGKAASGSKFKAKRYYKPLLTLRGPALEFAEKYNITLEEANDNGWRYAYSENYLYIPIRNHYGGHIADYLKNLGEINDTRPKNLLLKHADVPLIHWPYSTLTAKKTDKLVAVEDPISSLIVGRSVDTVSILGTHLSAEAVMLLRGLKYKGLVLFLDYDAAGAAFKYKNKYNHWIPIEVMTPPKGYDPKDLSDAEIIKLYKALQNRNDT